MTHFKNILRTSLSAILTASFIQAADAKISNTDLRMISEIDKNIKAQKYQNAQILINELRNIPAKQVAKYQLFRAPKYKTPLNDLLSFIDRNPGFHSINSIKSIVEKRIYRGELDASFARQYFAKYGVKTLEGRLWRLDQAYKNRDIKTAKSELSVLWRKYILSPQIEQSLLKKMPSLFENWDHKLRADFLTNKGRYKDAIRNAAYASSAYKKLYETRYRLEKRKSKNPYGEIKQVAKSLQKDFGLKYSLLKHFYDKRDDKGTLKALQNLGADKSNVVYASKVWLIKFRAVHRLFSKNHSRNTHIAAYKILKAHGYPSNKVQFVDAEFKLGFAAMNRLGDLNLARTHFERSRKSSYAKKHISRIHYWLALLDRKIGNQTAYQQNLQKAAKYRFTFYGQLAGERLQKAWMRIPTPPLFDQNFYAELNNNDNADFIKIYNQLNQPKQLKRHYIRLRKLVKNDAQMAALVEFANGENNIHYAMDSARKGMTKGYDLQTYAYPLVKFPKFKTYTGKIDQNLVYGLIRQESLFDQYAVSPSGARGYMQIMPATGKYLAQKYKVGEYQLTYLHTKPELNLALGNSYIYDLTQNFGGSYVMSTAAYNAGGTWVKRWIEMNGDPRANQVSFLDWIEMIPKSETRNYVKKVLKNMQIYRVRNNKNASNTKLIDALTTGEK